jgi:hypothetical protein
MKIQHIEAVNMGNYQEEIAQEVLRLIQGMEFQSLEDFYEIENELITKACKNLAWHSVPQNGGLIAE